MKIDWFKRGAKDRPAAPFFADVSFGCVVIYANTVAHRTVLVLKATHISADVDRELLAENLKRLAEARYAT